MLADRTPAHLSPFSDNRIAEKPTRVIGTKKKSRTGKHAQVSAILLSSLRRRA